MTAPDRKTIGKNRLRPSTVAARPPGTSAPMSSPIALRLSAAHSHPATTCARSAGALSP